MVGNRCQWRAWKGGMITCQPLSALPLDRTSDFLLGPPAGRRTLPAGEVLFLSYPVWHNLRISKGDLYISTISDQLLADYLCQDEGALPIPVERQ